MYRYMHFVRMSYQVILDQEEDLIYNNNSCFVFEQSNNKKQMEKYQEFFSLINKPILGSQIDIFALQIVLDAQKHNKIKTKQKITNNNNKMRNN